MVLWEITLGTAYFLGLKRTYRLALKIQRRLISHKRPKIRQFVHRRTRAIFDAALKVHKSIQERDIEVGRNIGNWILRWLDRMKPSAQIRGEKPLSRGTTKTSATIRPIDSSHQRTTTGVSQPSGGRSRDRESDSRHLFISTRHTWRQSFPSISLTMRPTKPTGTDMQFRHLFTGGAQACDFGKGRFGSEPVIRNDIRQWLLQN